MPVLSTKFKQGDIVTHEGKNAVILWINKGQKTGAIKYIAPNQNHPTKWMVKVSELTSMPEKKAFPSGEFSFYHSVAR